MGSRKFTIAYRSTEELQASSLEIPPILRRLNGDGTRRELPRLVGVVIGFPCAVSGETEEDLKINAEKKIRSLLRVRRSRGMPNQLVSETKGDLTTQGKMRKVTIKIEEGD